MLFLIPALQGLLRAYAGVQNRVTAGGRERGDVPGWVLITLMTAGIVTVLWVLARNTLTGVFTDAVNGVVGSGGNG